MTNRVRLVEQHQINQTDPRYNLIDQAAFASKNLYNKVNYLVRQAFINEGKYLNYAAAFHLVKKSEEYKALPRKVSNQVLKQVHNAWSSFFKAIQAWNEKPEQFLGRPRLPGYKDKQGRNLLSYDLQAFSREALKKGIIRPSQLGIEVPTDKTGVQQVRVVPKKSCYVVEVVYEVEPEPLESLNYSLIAGIDPGLDNLVTVTSNKPGFMPVIVNGRSLKSMNQFYNKRKAKLQGRLPKGQTTSKRIQKLSHKRNCKVKDYLHKTSRYIVNLLIQEKIGTLVIGRNKNWKQQINIGKQNNQNFVNIPFAQLWEMVKYKAELVGIRVVFQEESYTSKCSFLDLEPIRKKAKYLGKRICRGLYRASSGQLINADCNGAYNIIRKASPEAFANGVEGIAVCPVRVKLFIGPPKTVL